MFKDGVTEAKGWRKGMGGIAKERGKPVRKLWGALTAMPDIPDLWWLPTLPSVSGGVKQTRPSSKGDLKHYSKGELARRLGTTPDSLYGEIKQLMKRQFRQEMKAIGNPGNPEILIDRAGNVWLQNATTGKAFNTGLPLDGFKK